MVRPHHNERRQGCDFTDKGPLEDPKALVPAGLTDRVAGLGREGPTSLPSVESNLKAMAGQDLAKWRARLDLTQVAAAEALCISLANIKAYEQGARKLPKRIAKLAMYIEKFGDIGEP